MLRETGQPVAVKVQYPGLASSVASDLTVLRAFNVLAALLFPDYRLAWLVDELAHKLGVELDFRCRAGQEGGVEEPWRAGTLDVQQAGALASGGSLPCSRALCAPAVLGAAARPALAQD